MDSLSVTASAIAILHLSNQIYKAVRSYYTKHKRAPEEIGHFLEELDAFGLILTGLKDAAARSESINEMSTRRGIPQQGTPLQSVKMMLEPNASLSVCHAEMDIFLKRVAKQGSVTGKLKWPCRKEEIYQIVNRLRILSSRLSLTIETDML